MRQRIVDALPQNLFMYVMDLGLFNNVHISAFPELCVVQMFWASSQNLWLVCPQIKDLGYIISEKNLIYLYIIVLLCAEIIC